MHLNLMDFQETTAEINSRRAESEVIAGNQCRDIKQFGAAISKYKCAICLFIYSIEDTPKKSQKDYFQYRINQILSLLNQVEIENGQNPSTIDQLMEYASDQTNKSKILRYSESTSLTSTVVYPPLSDTCSFLSKHGVFPSYPNPQFPSFPQIGSCEHQSQSAGSALHGFTQCSPAEPSTNLINSTYQSQAQIPQYSNNKVQVQPTCSIDNQLQQQANPITKQSQQLQHPNIQPQENQSQTNKPHSSPARISKASSRSSASASSTHHQNTAPLISERIVNMSNFEKIKVLGRGSFGNVYLAQEKTTGEYFAIKELLSIESSDDQRSFLREVEALTQAVYPAILHLRGFSINPSPAIVTEYLPGGSLQDVINGTKPMNHTQRIKALYGVASAMRYLHDRLNIVHRDLKPANVMLNEKLEPVVGDFGLAKMMTKMSMKQTQKAGSPVYMPPELLCGREYTSKVDVYSFGILCYELLSEFLAFANIDDLYVLIQQVVNGIRPDLGNTKITPCFRELINRCWDNDPEKRPSFKEIVREFRKDQYLTGIDQNDFMDYLSRLRKSE